MCQLGGAVGNVVPASHGQRYNDLQVSGMGWHNKAVLHLWTAAAKVTAIA